MTTTVESTGIKGADEFRAAAEKLGLTVNVKISENEPVLYNDGTVMRPACTMVMVIVEIPVPESLATSALALTERATTLHVCWKRDHNGRARGRWILGNYSTLGGHDDMHTLKRCHVYLGIMSENLQTLKRYVDAR